jgi:hypothetical protein
MPIFRTVDLQARNRVLKRVPGYEARAPYRDAIRSLEKGQVIELHPDTGESVRKLKSYLVHAAREVGRDITYDDTDEGTVVAWLSDVARRRRRRKQPRSESPAASETPPKSVSDAIPGVSPKAKRRKRMPISENLRRRREAGDRYRQEEERRNQAASHEAMLASGVGLQPAEGVWDAIAQSTRIRIVQGGAIERSRRRH